MKLTFDLRRVTIAVNIEPGDVRVHVARKELPAPTTEDAECSDTFTA